MLRLGVWSIVGSVCCLRGEGVLTSCSLCILSLLRKLKVKESSYRAREATTRTPTRSTSRSSRKLEALCSSSAIRTNSLFLPSGPPRRKAHPKTPRRAQKEAPSSSNSLVYSLISLVVQKTSSVQRSSPGSITRITFLQSPSLHQPRQSRIQKHSARSTQKRRQSPSNPARASTRTRTGTFTRTTTCTSSQQSKLTSNA